MNLFKTIDSKLIFSDILYEINEILFYIAKRNVKLIINQKLIKLK